MIFFLECKMTLQSDSTQNQETTCLNCLSYGIFDNNNNKLLTPCINCANDNNWIWNGKKCYGACNKIEINNEDLSINTYKIFYKERKYSVEYCLNIIPEECHKKFLELVDLNY